MNRIKYNKLKATIGNYQFNNLIASDKYLIFGETNYGSKATSLIKFADFLFTNSSNFELESLKCPRFVVLDKIIIDKLRKRQKETIESITIQIFDFFKEKEYLILRSSSNYEDSPENFSSGISKSIITNKAKLFELITDLIYEMDNLFIDKDFSIIIQELNGNKTNDLIYPTLSAYTNSVNYYPGFKAKREDPISFFAYGLGNYIANGGFSFVYSPINNSRIYNESDNYFYQDYFYAHNCINNETNKVDDIQINLENNCLPNFVLTNERFNEKHALFIEICKILYSDNIQIEYTININLDKFEINFLQSKEIRKDIIEAAIINNYSDWIEFEKPALGNGFYEFDNILFIDEFNNSSESNLLANKIKTENKRANNSTILIAPARIGSQDSNLGISINFEDISNFSGIIEYSSDNGRENSYGSHFFMNLINSKKPFICCRKEELSELMTENEPKRVEIEEKVKKIGGNKAGIYVDGNNGLAKIKHRKS